MKAHFKALGTKPMLPQHFCHINERGKGLRANACMIRDGISDRSGKTRQWVQTDAHWGENSDEEM